MQRCNAFHLPVAVDVTVEFIASLVTQLIERAYDPDFVAWSAAPARRWPIVGYGWSSASGSPFYDHGKRDLIGRYEA